MYKRQETFDKSIRLFIYISAILQLALGLLWLIKNITIYNPDPMCESYIQASKSLVVDDYMGILYAVFLKCFSWSKNGLGLSILSLYVCQIVILGVCIYTFVNTFFGKKIAHYDRLAIVMIGLFNPLSIQACCTVSPSTLIFSFLLCVIMCFYSYNESGNSILIALLAFSSLVLVFLNKEVGYVLALLYLVAGFVQIKKKRRLSFVYFGLSMVIIFSLIVSYQICVPYYYHRGRKSFWALAVQRISWNTVRDYEAEISNRFGFEFTDELTKTNQSPIALFTSYLFNLETRVPYKEVIRYYRFIVLRELSINTKIVMSSFLTDLMFYITPMIGALSVYMFGISDTQVSYALTTFVREWHSIFFVFFSFYATFSIFTCILGVFKLVKRKEVKKYWATITIIIIVGIATAIYNTTVLLRGFDYRNSWAVVVLCNMIYLGYLLMDKDKT